MTLVSLIRMFESPCFNDLLFFRSIHLYVMISDRVRTILGMIKMTMLGVTEKTIRVVSGKLVFMALVWGQLGMVVVMADCT